MRTRSRKNRRNGNNRADDNCPICGVPVKSTNLNGHIKKVHPEKDGNKFRDNSRNINELPGSLSKADRRRDISERRKKQDIMFALFIIVFAVVGLGGYMWYESFSGSDDGANESNEIGPEPLEETPEPIDNNNNNEENQDEVRIPLTAIDDGKAHFYSRNSNGKEIRYFVLQSSDGVYRAAYDACDVCYQEKKGYRQEGDDMVCNNCGLKFESVNINEIKGGCNPAPLDRTIDGEDLVIKHEDIDKGSKYF